MINVLLIYSDLVFAMYHYYLKKLLITYCNFYPLIVVLSVVA